MSDAIKLFHYNSWANNKVLQHLRNLPEGVHRETAEYPHPTQGILRASYSDILQHVVNHGIYHRGNITVMLRQLGHAGPSTDYVFYLLSLGR